MDPMAYGYTFSLCKFPELFDTFWQVIFPHVIQNLARHTATPKTPNHKLPLKSGRLIQNISQKNSPGIILKHQFLPTKNPIPGNFLQKHLFSARSSKMEVCLRPKNGSKKGEVEIPKFAHFIKKGGVYAPKDPCMAYLPTFG